MFEPTSPSTPQPPLPRPWAKYATWLILLGLVVAFFAVPSFHNNVVQTCNVSWTFLTRLLGFR
jgi:uncharacterized membrane protein